MKQEPKPQKQLPTQVPSIYQAALIRGPAYFQYQNYEIPLTGELGDYQIVDKIGRGKYSDVFKAVYCNEEKEKISVLKILKPVRLTKVKRQIKILLAMSHQSIIKLENVMYDTCSKTYALAFDYIQGENMNEKMSPFSAAEVKLYLKKLLQALAYCHANGIIHRDIKPQNVLIDRKKQQLKVIDWGLADFFLPKKEFNVRVASRFYKSPQLLLNFNYYDYSMDLWSVGCWFAGLIFRKGVFFRGMDNVDQLFKIGEIMGTESLNKYIKKMGLKPEVKIRQWLKIQSYPQIPLKNFQKQQNRDVATDAAIDLLQRLLTIDHEQRITAAEALAHRYFSE